MPRVLVPLIDGFEETEAIAAIDIMRRGGIDVVTAGIGKRKATGSHAISVETDAVLEDVIDDEWDAIVLPGGPGTKDLNKVTGLHGRLQRQARKGGTIGAICAAPSILAAAGLLDGRTVSCHPSVNDKLAGGRLSEDNVSLDGNIITSRGVVTAVEFGLALVGRLVSGEKACEIAGAICWRGGKSEE